MLATPAEFDAAIGPAPDAAGAARRVRRWTTGWGAAAALALGVTLGGAGLPLAVKLVRGTPPPGISFEALAVVGAAVAGVITFVALVIQDMTYDLIAAWGSDDPEQRSVRTRCLGLLALAALGGVGGAGAAYVWAIPSGEPASWTSLVVGAVLGTVGTFYGLARLQLGVEEIKSYFK